MPGLVKKSNLRLHTTLCVIPIPLQREKESQEDRHGFASRRLRGSPRPPAKAVLRRAGLRAVTGHFGVQARRIRSSQ
jgi:hypothetical protein